MNAEHEREQGYLPHETQPVLVPVIEDKEVEYVELATAVKARVDEFLHGVNLNLPEEQQPDNYRVAHVSYSEHADLSKMNLSDLGSRGTIAVDGEPDLVDADVFINGFHMASKTSVIGGKFLYSETEAKHSTEVVLAGELSAIHQLQGQVVVHEVDDTNQDEPRLALTDMTITVFTFKDGSTRTLYPHSAWGQPFPEDQKIPVAQQMGVNI